MKKISVVLPVYNEAESIEGSLKDVFNQEKELPGYQIYPVVVDDVRTNDNTEEIVKKLSEKNPKIHYIKTEPGLGVALIKGHQYALSEIKPDILAQMDADGQVGADVLIKFVRAIEEGYDLILGSRFVEGGKNLLSPSRRLFSFGLSVVCRVAMGPIDIGEFANSARAFTPELFRKINLTRLPWKEKSFIVQPSFLHEAILAGAKYKEVPLIFKNRAEGYSKNKIINYTYDVVTYALDARLHAWGLNIPLFHISRRIKTLIKFGIVGFAGTIVDFAFYNLLISYFLFPPATSKGISTEIAIINNFLFNHFWTFRHRKTKTNIWQKLGLFNLVSLGGLLIGVLLIKLLHTIYGDGVANIMGLEIAYYNLYFFATIPPVLTWNFTVNHLITWRHKGD
jgi:dolichol-phosphate mannosyltransferase